MSINVRQLLVFDGDEKDPGSSCMTKLYFSHIEGDTATFLGRRRDRKETFDCGEQSCGNS